MQKRRTMRYDAYIAIELQRVLELVHTNLWALVTLVSHLQPLWRDFTQGGLAPVFPFGLDPTCSDTRTIVPPVQKRPTAPDLSGFILGRLPGCDPNWERVRQCKGGKREAEGQGGGRTKVRGVEVEVVVVVACVGAVVVVLEEGVVLVFLPVVVGVVGVGVGVVGGMRVVVM